MPRWMDRMGVVLLLALSSACGSANDDGGSAGSSGTDGGAGTGGSAGTGGTGGYAGTGGIGGTGAYGGTGYGGTGGTGYGGTGGTGGSSATGGTGGGTGGTSGTGGSAGSCAHDVCEPGNALSDGCSTCVSTICEQDTYCCFAAWDEQCVDAVGYLCGESCPPPPCTSESCPNGCCTSSGYCYENGCQLYGVACGTYFDTDGVEGCDVCENDGTCKVCDGTSCTACVPDCEGKACGEPDGCGSRCEGDCPSGFCSLSLSACTTSCNAMTCPLGCCDAGICVDGVSDAACGAYGSTCSTCTGSTGHCLSISSSYNAPSPGGQCAHCDSTTCTGCCTTEGYCQSGVDDACGHAGASCVDCTLQGSLCGYGGTCVDCAAHCEGKACGEADGCGGTCKGSCPTGKTCVVGSTTMADGCYACGPATCPNGCCTADGTCESGGARDSCGSGGALCDDCGDQACVMDMSTYPFERTCGPCGSSCMPPYPGEPYCQSDGCGGICPGADCSGMGGDGTCMLDPNGYAQCMPSDWCDQMSCGGCCSWQGWFEASCEPGNLPTQCGGGGLSCVDCVALGTTCDVATQRCVECTPQCDSSNSCGQPDGCGGKCTGAIGHCPTTATCTDEGTCDCGSGRSLCYDASYNTICLDTDSDPEHCGSCYNTCPDGVACVDGACACPIGSHYCGEYQEPGVCTNLANDSEHCGTCSTTCPGTPCDHGVCGSCPSNTTACPYSDPPACANLDTDTNNCGACGNVCPDGYPCVGGFCDCGGGLVACGGTCIDILTSSQHCGGCNQYCPQGVPCQGGTCVCPGGTTLCYGACTNLDVDPDNCGQCGNMCWGQTCVGGTCM